MTEFEAIYKEYFRDVFLYIRGISGEEHIAEEVTQETFFRAMKAIKGFRGDCDIRKNKRLTSIDLPESTEKSLLKDESIDLERQ